MTFDLGGPSDDVIVVRVGRKVGETEDRDFLVFAVSAESVGPEVVEALKRRLDCAEVVIVRRESAGGAFEACLKPGLLDIPLHMFPQIAERMAPPRQFEEGKLLQYYVTELPMPPPEPTPMWRQSDQARHTLRGGGHSRNPGRATQSKRRYRRHL